MTGRRFRRNGRQPVPPAYVAKKPSSHLAPATHHAAWGLLARGGTSANVVSGHAEDQNSFVYVDSTTTPIVAVQLSGVGGQPLSVGFKARLQVSGVVRLRNNTGTGNLDQSICWPQVAVQGGSWQDIGPQMIGLTHGDNSFNDEVSIPVMGGTDVSPGVYDARIVCQRVYVTGGASQNKFNGDALVVTAVPR